MEIPVDSEIAVGNGYQESKWIAEDILAKTAESTPAKPIVVRVGQLSGGLNGAWNVSEWVPALVQSAKLVGCIPDDSRVRYSVVFESSRTEWMWGQDVSWIPVHIAAAALVDFLDPIPTACILHLVNPQPMAWSTLAQVIAADLEVPLVPYVDWLSQLEVATQTHEKSKSFRAPRLLRFFQSLNPEMTDAEDAFGFPKLDMQHALRSSETLPGPNWQLKETDAKNWMEYWRAVGLLWKLQLKASESKFVGFVLLVVLYAFAVVCLYLEQQNVGWM
jgi:thioester reductase-like protein